MDGPIDYRQLWLNLRTRMAELCANEANKAMSADSDVDIHRHQGAYRFGYTVAAEMDRFLDEARKEGGPLRQLKDAG